MNENVIARGFLLRIDFDALKQIEENSWTYNTSKRKFHEAHSG